MGFDLERTPLKDLAKLKKLIALVSIALGMCVRLGTHQHERIKKIKGKKHGYKANSFFRPGLNPIREMLKRTNKPGNFSAPSYSGGLS